MSRAEAQIAPSTGDALSAANAIVICPDDLLVMEAVAIPFDDDTMLLVDLQEPFEYDLLFEDDPGCGDFYIFIEGPETSGTESPVMLTGDRAIQADEGGEGGDKKQEPALELTAFGQSRGADIPGTEDSASVSGTVFDASGGTVSGAKVTLTESGSSETRSVVSGPDGTFAFYELPGGSYIIVVQAKGFQQFTSGQFEVAAQQSLQVAKIVLALATLGTKVIVRPTEAIAAREVKAEEKQRVLSVIPNFYTSYVWNAAPLDTKQKFSLAIRDTFDPTAFVGASVAAGIEQARNSFPGYGQGADGYGKRWGALFANGRTSDILSRAVFPSLFHQDPRYFYQGSGSTWSRIRHAVGEAFVARSDGGHTMPNYSYFLGDLCSGALSNLYYPASNRGASLVFTNAAIDLAGRAGQNLLQEFLFKHLTKHVPGNGKPATGSDHQ